jgi:hypothetical protein
MQAQMAPLIEQARGALERFPDNECTRMLAEMPGHLRADTIAEP